MNENMRNFCIILLSLPVWERGLKSFVDQGVQDHHQVAPRVGAWIEIMLWKHNHCLLLVAPRVGAWIEINRCRGGEGAVCVAPRVGAWIEIINNIGRFVDDVVAPRVGAWIEIYDATNNVMTCTVAPRVGAWIEICCGMIWKQSGMRRSPCGSVD